MASTICLVACREGEQAEVEVIASVNQTVLTKTMLQSKLPADLNSEDSARFADQVVSAWIREQALMHLAESNLTEAQKDVQQQLEANRRSLLIYAHEEAFLRQKMDTVVTDNELRAYYDANSQNFQLKRHIVKLKFVKIAEDAPNQADVEKWFKSSKEQDYDLLHDYCRKFAENFFFNVDVWLYLDDVAKEVPLPQGDVENFLSSGSFHVMEQEGFRYFVSIAEYRLRGEQAPFSLEKSRMRDFILNKRKAELISKMREDVVKEGQEEGWIKISQP